MRIFRHETDSIECLADPEYTFRWSRAVGQRQAKNAAAACRPDIRPRRLCPYSERDSARCYTDGGSSRRPPGYLPCEITTSWTGTYRLTLIWQTVPSERRPHLPTDGTVPDRCAFVPIIESVPIVTCGCRSTSSRIVPGRISTDVGTDSHCHVGLAYDDQASIDQLIDQLNLGLTRLASLGRQLGHSQQLSSARKPCIRRWSASGIRGVSPRRPNGVSRYTS